MNHKFGITEDNIVHRYDNGCGWRLLGRLPSILGEPTPIGREVRDWWKALVESDEPCPILVLKIRGWAVAEFPPPQPSSPLGGHLGFEHPMHAFAANDTWQGKRNAECCVVIADRNHRPLIARYQNLCGDNCQIIFRSNEVGGQI